MTVDLRHALRRLARDPGFTAVTVVVLGLGLGAAAAVFGVVNGLFLRPLPGVSGSDRLVTLYPSAGASAPLLRHIDESATTLSSAAGYVDMLMGVDAGLRAERRLGLLVSNDYFRVLGVRPAAGRLLAADGSSEDPRVAVIAHGLWERRFGADPASVGATLTLNGEPFRIVGVTPEGFVGAVAGFRFDVWVPLSAAPYVAPALDLEDPTLDRIELIGRLDDGATLERAREELRRIAAGFVASRPELPAQLEIAVRRFTGFDDDLRGPVRGLLLVLAGIAGLLLLIALTNAVGILTVRAVGRSREIAVRRALGGAPSRASRPLFLEGVALALLGGLLALAFASLAGRWFEATVAAFPVDLALDFGLDLRVAGFALVLALGTGLVVGALPAASARDRDLRAALGGGRGGEAGGREASRLRRGLVTAQIAGSTLLLVVGGVTLHAVRETTRFQTGFRSDSVHVAPFLDLRLAGIDDAEAGAFYDRLLREVGELAGVGSVALSTAVPLDFTGPSVGYLEVPGVAPPPGADGFEVGFASVSSGYLETLGMGMLRGRAFRASDGEPGAGSVAIVSRALADRFWPGEEAVGRRVTLDGVPARVVGVAPDLRYRPLPDRPGPFVYLPLERDAPPRAALLVRSSLPPGAVATAVRSAARGLAPSLPVELQPLASYQRIAVLPQRLVAGTAALLGALGSALAGLGVYGVVAFRVVRRRREIGIRVAVGAGSADVLRLVLGEGFRPAAAGLAAGGLLAWPALRLLPGLSSDLSAAVPPAAAAALGVLLVAVLAGTALPARRALRVDPSTCLREE